MGFAENYNEIDLGECTKKYFHKDSLEVIEIPNLIEHSRLVREIKRDLKEMPLFQEAEECNPLIENFRKLARLDLIICRYLSEIDNRIKGGPKEGEELDYIQSEYNMFNQEFCTTIIAINKIKERFED